MLSAQELFHRNLSEEGSSAPGIPGQGLLIQGLSVELGGKNILRELSFSVEEGQWLMIVGPNGAGKTTALRAILQSVPSAGEIFYHGQNLRKMSPSKRALRIGMLSQSHHASYAFSVREVASLGRYAHEGAVFPRRSRESEEAVDRALALTGMEAQKFQSVLTLSGGELQRTFLAQVFAQDPELLLLDEPANHLDLVYQKQIFELISHWVKKPGRSVVSVVHDLSTAKAFGTHALLLDQGRAVAQGPCGEVLRPELLNAVYRMDVSAWMRKMLSQWNNVGNQSEP